jgi:hypothetical protein
MIYEKILNIQDIIATNFLTFDEQMIPALTFVNPSKYDENIQEFDNIIKKLNDSRKYEIECIDSDSFGQKFKYEIKPKYYYLNDEVTFLSKEWSIEEMVEILIELNN